MTWLDFAGVAGHTAVHIVELCRQCACLRQRRLAFNNEDNVSRHCGIMPVCRQCGVVLTR